MWRGRSGQGRSRGGIPGRMGTEGSGGHTSIQVPRRVGQGAGRGRRGLLGAGTRVWGRGESEGWWPQRGARRGGQKAWSTDGVG